MQQNSTTVFIPVLSDRFIKFIYQKCLVGKLSSDLVQEIINTSTFHLILSTKISNLLLTIINLFRLSIWVNFKFKEIWTHTPPELKPSVQFLSRQLKIFEIWLTKVLPKIVLPFRLERILLLLMYLCLIEFEQSIKKIFFSLQSSFSWLFASLALFFKLSFLNIIDDRLTSYLSLFNTIAFWSIDSAMHLAELLLNWNLVCYLYLFGAHVLN